jgi:protein FAM50
MTDYKGSTGDGNRIRELERQRELQLKQLQAQKDKIKQEAKEKKVGAINEKFSSKNDNFSDMFTRDTVGLVTVDDFRKRREALEQEEARKRKLEEELKKKNRAKKPRVEKSKLSFELEEDEEENNDEDTELNNTNKGFGKDPKVDTDFLPDKEREETEARERERLAQEWVKEQEALKAQTLTITYSYWDGSGHRRQNTVTKGTTVEQFLELTRQEFKELRGVPTEQLMFVKEDLIIPQQYSFYDLIVTKARGKSGPLFSFDVHDDIRLLHDATVEKDESHAAKVVERRWYERNKHIFPASRWEIYDPAIQRDKYTIHDRISKH